MAVVAAAAAEVMAAAAAEAVILTGMSHCVAYRFVFV
jgi:hypothetical protein